MIYFGFTFCPDICPDECFKQQEVIEKLDEIYKKKLGNNNSNNINNSLTLTLSNKSNNKSSNNSESQSDNNTNTHALLKNGGPVLPVYITIDPNRDSCAQMEEYCKEFHPRLLGLTGTMAMIKKVTRLFRVYYNEGIRTDNTEDYLVDHSIIHYFCDRNGEFVDFFGKNLTADEIVKKIEIKIDADLAQKQR